MKERAVPTTGKAVVRLSEKWGRMRLRIRDASENPMRAVTENKLVLNVCVGESGERSVRAPEGQQQQATAESKEVAEIQ